MDRNHQHRYGNKPRPVEVPYAYHWTNMRPGMQKVCPSPIDAVLEVLMYELKYPRLFDLLIDLGIDHAAISRARHKKEAINHHWLLRAAILANIPYIALCELASEKPKFTPHPNARKEPK